MPAQANSAKDLQRMSAKPTLVRPPSPEHGKAQIEHILELTQLNDIDPVCFPFPSSSSHAHNSIFPTACNN